MIGRRLAARAWHGYLDVQLRVLEHAEFTVVWPDIDGIPGFLHRAEASVLYHLARFGPGQGDIVEIGSYLGRSTAALGFGAYHRGGTLVHAVDPHEGNPEHRRNGPVHTEAGFRANLTRLGLDTRVRPWVMPSAQAAKEYDAGPVRLLFIDGLHTEEAVREDYEGWRPHLDPDAVVVFDDFRTSPEVACAIRALRPPGHAFRIGKMLGFMPARQTVGPIRLWWVPSP